MAITIYESSLSVTLNEDLNLNGVAYGNNVAKTFAGNGKVLQRIMEIPFQAESAKTEIINFGAADEAGQVIEADYTYFRITNTDSATDLVIQLYISATKSSFFKVNAGCSFVLMGNNDSDVSCVDATYSLANITKIYGKHNGIEADAAIYIEYVAVTEGGVPVE